MSWNVGKGQISIVTKWLNIESRCFFLRGDEWVSQWFLLFSSTLTSTLTWNQRHLCTSKHITNKQTIMHGYFKPRLKPCYLSKQPIHKQNIKNEKARVDLNGFSSLLSQTEIFHFINKHGQGSVTGGGPKCLHHCLAPPPHAVDELPDSLLRNGIPFLNQNLTQSCQCCFI